MSSGLGSRLGRSRPTSQDLRHGCNLLRTPPGKGSRTSPSLISDEPAEKSRRNGWGRVELVAILFLQQNTQHKSSRRSQQPFHPVHLNRLPVYESLRSQ